MLADMPDVPKRAIWVVRQTTQPIDAQYRQSRSIIHSTSIGSACALPTLPVLPALPTLPIINEDRAIIDTSNRQCLHCLLPTINI